MAPCRSTHAAGRRRAGLRSRPIRRVPAGRGKRGPHDLGVHPGPQRSGHRRPDRPTPSSPRSPCRRGGPAGRRGGGGRRRLDRRHRRYRPAGPGPGSSPPTPPAGRARRCGSPSEAEGDLIAFVDGDVTNFGPHFVTGLLGPLLTDDIARLGQGLLPTSAPRRAGRWRPGHRAHGQARHRPALPVAGVDPPAPGRRDGGAPLGASRSAAWPTATPSNWRC